MTVPRLAGIAVLIVIAIILAFGIDHTVARMAAAASPTVLTVFRFITWFGQGGVILVPSGLILLGALWLRPRLPSLAGPIRRTILQAGLLFAAVAAAGLVNDGLKLLFSRARPRLWLNGDQSGFFFERLGSDYQSFPSGHTATSVAAAIVLAGLFPRWRLAFAAFAIVIASSRILLDAHYLSDVIAGAAVGVVAATVTLAWFRGRGWASGGRSQGAGFTSVQ